MHSGLGVFHVIFAFCGTLVVQNVEKHRRIEAQQQLHVSNVSTGKRRSGLVKFDQLRLVHDNRLTCSLLMSTRNVCVNE